MKRQIFLVASILLVSGIISCATAPKQLTPEEQSYLRKVMAFPLTFTISKADEKEAWGRAQSWIGQFSSMKTQMVTDYVIQTYNPFQPLRPSFGYYVTKEPVEDKFQISVKCIRVTPLLFKKQSEQNAHILAYYIKTGEMNPSFISR